MKWPNGKMCKKEFANDFNLRKHIAQQHKKKGAHPCDQCNVTCSDPYALKTHKKEKHGGGTLHSCILYYIRAVVPDYIRAIRVFDLFRGIPLQVHPKRM